MRAGAAVGLRGEDESAPEEWDDKMVAWVCPGPLRKYVKEQTKRRGKGITERAVYIEALELDKALEEGLSTEGARVRAFAAAQGLDLKRDFAQVIVRLVRAGLDAADVKPQRAKK